MDRQLYESHFPWLLEIPEDLPSHELYRLVKQQAMVRPLDVGSHPLVSHHRPCVQSWRPQRIGQASQLLTTGGATYFRRP